jgi:D-aminopeptidase
MFVAACALAAAVAAAPPPQPEARPRARDAGVVIGTLEPGPLNAITDVDGVRVGHTTVIRGETIRTGVTAVLPHGGNLFQEKVPGAVFVGNGFGKIAGTTQVEELGEIETPILLTSTLNVPRVADALLDYMLALPGKEQVRSINPLVAETNDGALNDIRARAVGREEVFHHRLGEGRPGRGGRGRRRHRHDRLRLQGRHRHGLAQGGGRVDGGRAGADELRRPADDRRRPGRTRAHPEQGQRLVHHRHRHRRAG